MPPVSNMRSNAASALVSRTVALGRVDVTPPEALTEGGLGVEEPGDPGIQSETPAAFLGHDLGLLRAQARTGKSQHERSGESPVRVRVGADDGRLECIGIPRSVEDPLLRVEREARARTECAGESLPRPGDPQSALMDRDVMRAAEQQHVVQIRGATLAPHADVVSLEVGT